MCDWIKSDVRCERPKSRSRYCGRVPSSVQDFMQEARRRNAAVIDSDSTMNLASSRKLNRKRIVWFPACPDDANKNENENGQKLHRWRQSYADVQKKGY